MFLLWLNFSLTWKSLHNKATISPQQCCNNRGLVVNLLQRCKIFHLCNKSSTNPQHLQHVHTIRNMFITIYTYGNAFTSRARQSHSHYHTFTTNLRSIPDKRTTVLTTRPGFLQPHNHMTTSPHNSQQLNDHCIVTALQQVYKKMIYMETRLEQLFSRPTRLVL